MSDGSIDSQGAHDAGDCRPVRSVSLFSLALDSEVLACRLLLIPVSSITAQRSRDAAWTQVVDHPNPRTPSILETFATLKSTSNAGYSEGVNLAAAHG